MLQSSTVLRHEQREWVILLCIKPLASHPCDFKYKEYLPAWLIICVNELPGFDWMGKQSAVEHKIQPWGQIWNEISLTYLIPDLKNTGLQVWNSCINIEEVTMKA